MRIETTIAGLRAARRELAGDLGLVPTMGALHEGHLSLVRAARISCNSVAASIFVNPAQFGPNEDLDRYPRTFERDCEMLEREGVELLFAPTPADMYPEGALTRIHVGPVADRLDGVSRPGHFVGVATIVAKLFNVFAPQRAFFGQKDAAQLAVLQQMVRDLDFDVELVVCPTARDPDGLAMSSRNRYLSPDERSQALVLSRSLAAGAQIFRALETKASEILHAAQMVLASEPGVRVDYVALVDRLTLLPVEHAQAGSLLAVAGYVGSTRLIDNLVL